MTDKELLELAAKAAGLTVHWHDSGHYGPTMEIMEDESGGPPWNPLKDDGDALRLAVKLQMNIDIIEEAAGAHVINYRFCSELNNGDPYAATRRAVVRCAAEIGKGMP